MKSCFGMLLAILVLVLVIGSIGGIYYLSSTSAFARKEAPAGR